MRNDQCFLQLRPFSNKRKKLLLGRANSLGKVPYIMEKQYLFFFISLQCVHLFITLVRIVHNGNYANAVESPQFEVLGTRGLFRIISSSNYREVDNNI